MAEAAVEGVQTKETARPPRLSFTSRKYLTYGAIAILGILVVLAFQFDLSFMQELSLIHI